MAKCVVCHEDIADERSVLGYTTCLVHGDKDAQADIESKKKRVGINYSKGNYVYLGDERAARKAALDMGRKDGGLAESSQDISRIVTLVPTAPKQVVQPKRKRKLLAIVFENGGRRVILEK
jgi:hypothetical protein